MEDDKEIFRKGSRVRLKHDLTFTPLMYVQDIQFFKTNIEGDKKIKFVGIKCRWFTEKYELREAVFNSKDLKQV